MGRFFLFEMIITAGVLYLIYRLILWIGKATKKKLDQEEKCQDQQNQEEIK